MGKSVNYFIYFVVAVYILADIRSSAGQWNKCDGNPKLTNRVTWRCVKRTNCVFAAKLPAKSTVMCGQDDLCCPEFKTSTTSVQRPTISSKTSVTTFAEANETAWNMCNEYARYRFLNYTIPSPFIGEPDIPVSKLNCTRVVNLILGGDPAEPNEYPHMALLGYDDEVTDPSSWRCGGSLISEEYILSAAHCTNANGHEVKWAALGLLSRDDIKADLIGKNLFQIVQRINHPEYRTGKGDNDIALLKLKYPIEFSPTIRPVCLQYPESLKTNDRASVTGWGKTFTDREESRILLKASIRLLSNNRCSMIYANDANLRNGFNTSTMICGGDHSGKKDTCGGDSGGPMQILVPRMPCMWIQVGITALGPVSCGTTPAIYTRVAYYLPWIQSFVWSETNGKRPSLE